jgi:F-type H+-transporting ATPase subunit alpha
MMELLKQGVFEPVTVAKQTCAIYAWAKGYFDEIEVSKIKKVEADLYLSLDEEKTILESITKDGKMSEDAENKLKEIISKVVELNK